MVSLCKVQPVLAGFNLDILCPFGAKLTKAGEGCYNVICFGGRGRLESLGGGGDLPPAWTFNYDSSSGTGVI